MLFMSLELIGSEWVNIERYQDSPLSEQSIYETFELCFCKKLEPAYWRWRFLQNPNDSKVYINYIVEGNTLCAYYAVSPFWITLADGTSRKIALSNMTMTHPNYRGMGLFSDLANEMLLELRRDGFAGIYGFANHNSHRTFRGKLGWRDLCIASFLRNKNTNSTELRQKNEINNLVCRIGRLSEKHARLCARMVYCQSSISTKRDYANIMWRLVENPLNKYFALEMSLESGELLCVCIFKQYEDGSSIDIMDIYISRDSEFEFYQLVANICDHLQKTYSLPIALWSNLSSSRHLAYEKSGFLETEFAAYFGVIPLAEPESEIYRWLVTPESWHYSLYDSDVF